MQLVRDICQLIHAERQLAQIKIRQPLSKVVIKTNQPSLPPEFEEIIKEGRKFGVFITIASQRPNDISETIISQAHNYFIHQLINQRDLLTIGSSVSYIDKITEESIPTLSIGTCIFSGIATPMPLKIRINELPDSQKPDSHTIKFHNL